MAQKVKLKAAGAVETVKEKSQEVIGGIHKKSEEAIQVVEEEAGGVTEETIKNAEFLE